MDIRVPDTLTLDCSEKYILSIRLVSDGLSFALWIPSEKESFFYERITFPPTESYLDALKALFFEHDLFRYPYKRRYVISTTAQYTLVPEVAFSITKKEELMQFLFSLPQTKILHQRMKAFDAELLYGIPLEVYEFCARTLEDTHFTHAMVPQLSAWKRRSLELPVKQLYVVYRDQEMDVACFEQSSLLLVNSFEADNMNDRLYYTLALWKSLEMRQLADELVLSAPPSIYAEMKEELSRYIENVQCLNPERSLELPDVPDDLLALFRCES